VRRWLWPLLAYLTAAVVATWPLVLHPRALLGAPSGAGDPYLNLWILGWGMQAILSNPASVFTGAVFDANIFYPATGTLAYSDHLLLQSLLLAPLYAITHDVVLCYNVLLIASLVASALAMHLLVRSVVCTESGAYLAGLAWGFGSYHFAHLIHLQLQSRTFCRSHFSSCIGSSRAAACATSCSGHRDRAAGGIVRVLRRHGGLALVVGAVALAGGVGRWRNSAAAPSVLRRVHRGRPCPARCNRVRARGAAKVRAESTRRDVGRLRVELPQAPPGNVPADAPGCCVNTTHPLKRCPPKPKERRLGRRTQARSANCFPASS
jgi:hypothetical protein